MKAILNWRYYVVAVMLAVTLFLIGGGSDNEMVFYLSKPLGFACGYAMYRLVKRWESEGKIPEFANQKYE